MSDEAYEAMVDDLQLLVDALRRAGRATVTCSDMADALYDIIDDCDIDDIISDLALDIEAGV